MTLGKLLLISSVTGLGVLWLAAWVVPHFLLSNDDHIERLAQGDPQAVEYAETALWSIRHGVCSQLGALTCTGVNMVKLKPVKANYSKSNKLPQSCRYPYEGKAIVYSLFGVPAYEIKIDCDLFWHLVFIK